MRRATASLALSGAIVTGGLAGAVLGVPSLSGAQTDDTTVQGEEGLASERRGGRIERVLDGLVADGTINQDQADAIVVALREEMADRGHRGRGHRPHRGLHLKVAAHALDMPVGELVVELRAGKTLAAVAAEQGVAVDALIDALVGTATERIAAAVEAGKLEQARADELRAGLRDKITTMVNEGTPGRGGPQTGA